jgi:hypothetical protein
MRLRAARQPEQPKPDVFGPEFFAKIGTAFRQCSRTRRAAIIVALAVTVIAGVFQNGPWVVLGLIAAIGLLTTRPPVDPTHGLPTDEQLAPQDQARELDDIAEYEASGLGRREYDRALSRLQGLIQRDVTVLFGDGDSFEWRPVIRLQGILSRVRDAGTAGTELFEFSVGADGSFWMDEASFVRGEAIVRNGDSDEIMLILGGVTLLIFETTPANA